MAKRYRVIVTPTATAQLHEIHRFIERDSPQNAAAVMLELIEAIDRLEELPHRYREYEGAKKLSAIVRRMPVPPYLVFYRVDDPRGVVEIVTVRHGARREPESFGGKS